MLDESVLVSVQQGAVSGVLAKPPTHGPISVVLFKARRGHSRYMVDAKHETTKQGFPGRGECVMQQMANLIHADRDALVGDCLSFQVYVAGRLTIVTGAIPNNLRRQSKRYANGLLTVLQK